ncbi:MAG: alkaline phosphatase family protein [Proteobacteria bacterium]|nr:alkaline phosphatase family protein [Pseudomonadota bacterium]MBU1685722.1 alkaline phosphatase family protein [Pseudomonadota bacterium]
MQKNRAILPFLIVLTTVALAVALFVTRKPFQPAQPTMAEHRLKLYWFIPDGLRAEPSLFTIYRWAEEGLLPNLKKMMNQGSYGYSIPVFPGHTPTNFATLLTGASPRVHGIADGPMHIEGYPLRMVSKGGFSSVAKKVPPIWYDLERSGMQTTLLSVPGSTPPELDLGTTIRGRWGGWGVDFPAVIFHSAADETLRKEMGVDNRVFNFGAELTRFITAQPASGWLMALPESYSPHREVTLTNWGNTIHACLYDTTDDHRENYDRVLFSRDKKEVLTSLTQGEWSPWLPITLSWEIQNDYNIQTPKRMAWERNMSSIPVETQLAINVVKLGDADFFRIQFFYNNLNPHLVKPTDLTSEILTNMGPMVDFPDNYPPQLIYYPEDKATFLEETRRSLDWHRRMAGYLINRGDSDVIIHDIYTPNQMLVSRWWLGGIDPASRKYKDTDPAEHDLLWQEVKEMYQGIDAILGEVLAKADPQTYIVLSSDHGIVPLDREVRLNNLFAQEGLLIYRLDATTGIYEINWQKTRAVFLKMDNIYLNPDGLGGNYHRASGPAYEALRDQVTVLLNELKDTDGTIPVVEIVKWEEAEERLQLPADRVGDLVVANRPTYGLVEDLTADREIFHDALKSGYKQAILPDQVEAMRTPFVIMGPGVRKNHQLSKPIRHIDQYPTIMTLLGQAIPDFVEGQVVQEVMETHNQ